MFDLIADLLAYFFELTHSYSSSIALLTLVVLVIATPLTLRGTRSMLRMQILQPELKAIQDKYKPEQRQEMNEEMLEFYRENNINPVGGCLPLVFQIPVFLVLYRVILGLTRRATDVGSQFGVVAGSVGSGSTATTFEATEAARFNPSYLAEDAEMFRELTMSNEMNSLGVDLSQSASGVLSGDGVISALPYLIIVVVVGATGWFQHRMIRSRNTGAVVNPTQEMIMKLMPWFLPVFAFTLPAAIVIYFLVSNLYRIGQQWYITYTMYHGDDSLGSQVRQAREDAAKSAKSDKSKGGGGSKGGGSKGGSSKGGSSKSGKNTRSSGGKNKSGSRAGAPGRNRSGVQGSARTQVQPRARKKKKR